MSNEECRHNSSVSLPDSGEIFYPEQEGLQPGQVRCTDGCNQVFESDADLQRARGFDVPEPEELKCLDAPNEGCSGTVELRMPLSGTGRSFPRCDAHWKKRLDKQEQIVERYAPFSDVPPAGFDPTYAGERWDEDY